MPTIKLSNKTLAHIVLNMKGVTIMEEKELNIEELLEINGGQNDAAIYLTELAKSRKFELEDGTIDIIRLKDSLSSDDIKQIEILRRRLRRPPYSPVGPLIPKREPLQ